METTFVLWFAGVSVTGFMFLAAWSWSLHDKYSVISGTSKKVNDIHKALLGDMENEGLISKLRRLEDNCRIRHGEVVKT